MGSNNRRRASDEDGDVRRLVDEAHRDEVRHRAAVAGERCPHGNVSSSWASCARCVEEQEGLDELAARQAREAATLAAASESPGFRHTTTYGPTTRHRFDLGPDPAAAYYEVGEDGDTEWVTYVGPGGARTEHLLVPFGSWTRAGLRAVLAEHAARVGWDGGGAAERLITAILDCLSKPA